MIVYKDLPADTTEGVPEGDTNSVVEDEEYCNVYIMHNEMCILVAPVDLSKEVKSISFEKKIIEAGDKVHGKRKKGAHSLREGGALAVLTYDDGTQHTLKTPVGGCVFEINENIVSNPELMKTQRVGSGYLAVIYPKTMLPQLQH